MCLLLLALIKEKKMGIKNICVCDCCGKELTKTSDIFHLDFKTNTFLDAAGSRDYNFERIDLCESCVKRAVVALETIAKTTRENTKQGDRRINNMSKTIKIKYFDNEIDKIKKIDKGDWIDLRSAEEVELKAGEFKLIKLGVGMILPDGYEAHIVPRSSTYKNFGVIQTNHCGIVDESYCGDNDEWRFPAFALRDTVIHKGDRICQFRIVEKQPSIDFEIVEHLKDTDRGGFGSTGKG